MRGVSIKELTRRTELARNTIRAALRSDAPPAFRCPERPSMLDPFEDEIHRPLENDPRLPGVRVRDCSSRSASGTYQVTSELLAHSYELTGEQLNDVRKVVGELKATNGERQATGGERRHSTFKVAIKALDPEPADTDCERDELGVIADSVVDEAIAQLRAETNGALYDGAAPAKSVVRPFGPSTPLDLVGGLADDAERHAVQSAPVEIATFEC